MHFAKKYPEAVSSAFGKTPEELTYRVTIALSKAFGEMPGIGWIRGNAVASEELLGQINNLRNLVDQLRTENEDFREKTKPRLDGIAGLSEEFPIRFTYVARGSRDRVEDHCDLTWAEIFAACGPNFFRPTAASAIDHAIVQYLKENSDVEAGNFIRLFDSDENRIKIQLLALGLIETTTPLGENEGIAEFLSLTPKGRQQLLELLAVRGTTQRAPEEE